MLNLEKSLNIERNNVKYLKEKLAKNETVRKFYL